MKGNLMDSVVSLASITKRYDIWMEIGCVESDGTPEFILTKYSDEDIPKSRSIILNPDILMQDLEDIFKRFVEECNGM